MELIPMIINVKPAKLNVKHVVMVLLVVLVTILIFFIKMIVFQSVLINTFKLQILLANNAIHLAILVKLININALVVYHQAICIIIHVQLLAQINIIQIPQQINALIVFHLVILVNLVHNVRVV
jgi:hypothetical protein